MNLENLVEKIRTPINNLAGALNNLADSIRETKTYAVMKIDDGCRGPEHKYKRVVPLIIVDKVNKYSTEVRCVRYEKGNCNKSKTEPSSGEQKDETLLECIYRPHKNKPNDKID